MRNILKNMTCLFMSVFAMILLIACGPAADTTQELNGPLNRVGQGRSH